MAPHDHGNSYRKCVMMVVMGVVGGGVWQLLSKYVQVVGVSKYHFKRM